MKETIPDAPGKRKIKGSGTLIRKKRKIFNFV